MRRRGVAAHVVFGIAAAFSLVASFVIAGASAISGCNAVLGIDVATLEAGAVVDPTSCDFYCDTVMANCSGNTPEYVNRDICLAMCQKFDPGLAGAQVGDSRACRIAHAQAAASTPESECRSAGPVGFPHCALDPCRPFCSLVEALCATVPPPPPPPYGGNEGDCVAACMSGRDAGFRYDFGPGASDIPVQGSNTLNCRIYHIESAYDPNTPGAAQTHCQHTEVISATCF
jgi:hypothetical protein